MALAIVCAYARSARFVVLVLLGSALVGLWLPHVLPPVTERYSRIPSRDGESGRIPQAEFRNDSSSSAIRSPDDINSQRNVSVRTVALKQVDVGRGNDRHHKHSYDSDDVGASWSPETGMKSSEKEVQRIGKRMTVTRRGRLARSLRTSQPYPCTLPTGRRCQTSESCCGTVCADTTTNPNHCGRCGHICRPDRACCNGKCRRLATDERNCGRCGTRCALGTKCLFGLCGY